MATTKKRSRKYLYIASVVIVIIAAVAILEVTNTTHFFHKAAVVSAPSKPLTKLPAQASANNGTKNPASPTAANQGTATDKNGQVPSSGVSDDPSQWSTSDSRLITVKSPLRNSTFKSGDTVTGATSVADQVQYRLVDNQAGVIGQGSINVVNGNFTASLNFTASGSSGSLDIFSTDQSGKESNEVQIPINF
jgi:hypothetical protein